MPPNINHITGGPHKQLKLSGIVFFKFADTARASWLSTHQSRPGEPHASKLLGNMPCRKDVPEFDSTLADAEAVSTTEAANGLLAGRGAKSSESDSLGEAAPEWEVSGSSSCAAGIERRPVLGLTTAHTKRLRWHLGSSLCDVMHARGLAIGCLAAYLHFRCQQGIHARACGDPME